jgi:hypothetical protein
MQLTAKSTGKEMASTEDLNRLFTRAEHIRKCILNAVFLFKLKEQQTQSDLILRGCFVWFTMKCLLHDIQQEVGNNGI